MCMEISRIVRKYIFRPFFAQESTWNHIKRSANFNFTTPVLRDPGELPPAISSRLRHAATPHTRSCCVPWVWSERERGRKRVVHQWQRQYRAGDDSLTCDKKGMCHAFAKATSLSLSRAARATSSSRVLSAIVRACEDRVQNKQRDQCGHRCQRPSRQRAEPNAITQEQNQQRRRYPQRCKNQQQQHRHEHRRQG